jgi:hypothetical protein
MTRQQARETDKKTGSLKYSGLYEKPMGSFNLISPEMMNKIPTNILENWVIIFSFIFF